MKIHPTAQIAKEVDLAGEVEIGAFAVLEGPVKVGSGTRIQHHAILTGDVKVGENNLIGYGAVIGADPQDGAFRSGTPSGVRIGNGNVIREYATLHRGTTAESHTVVGDNNFLMGGAHLGHNVRLGNDVVIANGCLLAGYVEVGDRAFLGGGSVFHQFMRIGRLAMVKGGCRFGKDIPPFLTATGENQIAGVNSVGLRRAEFSPGERREIKQAFQLLYREGLNVSQALARAAERTWTAPGEAFFEFVRQAKSRGLCDYVGRIRKPEED